MADTLDRDPPRGRPSPASYPAAAWIFEGRVADERTRTGPASMLDGGAVEDVRAPTLAVVAR